MKKYLLFFCLINMLIACSSEFTEKPTSKDVQKFIAAQASCKALFPCEPTVVENVAATKAGEIPNLSYRCTNNETAYMLDYAVYPEQLLAALGSKDVILKSAKDAILSTKFRLVREMPLVIRDRKGQEHRGLAFEAESGQHTVFFQMYMVGSSFYRMAVLSPKNNLATTDQVRSFLESLELLESSK